jgi:hypothetical protein
MQLSELAALVMELLKAEGDMEAVTGDMRPLKKEDIKVVLDSCRDKKFLHIGEW